MFDDNALITSLTSQNEAKSFDRLLGFPAFTMVKYQLKMPQLVSHAAKISVPFYLPEVYIYTNSEKGKKDQIKILRSK